MVAGADSIDAMDLLRPHVGPSEPLSDGTFADLLRFDLLVDEWEGAHGAPVGTQ